jgi:pSer/pThr/pTyr-binding forkhead associated (FHA) protein/tetratricopeptide (TPR) repeat protein
MLKLIIEDDEGHTTVVPLVRDEVTIGRKEGNTIRLTERNVSRRHARLLRQEATFAVEDLSSYTGVRVNGQRIQTPTPLKDGDRIQIGDYRLDLRSDEPRPSSQEDTATLPSLPKALLGGNFAPTPAAAALASARTTAPALPTVEALAASARLDSPPSPSAPPPAPAVATVAPVPAAPVPSPALHSPVPRSAPPPTPPAAAGAPAALDGTPTIPLRTLDSPSEPVVLPEKASRLVVLNTELGGHEFSLSRPSQVIGRTDENDIVLNHRSISRHHAKVLREGSRIVIVDLQSANGVRVNGQDYERVELQPGDVIELGHVKLRHVGADEAFVFSPSAFSGRIKPLWLAGGGAGAVALAALLFLMFHRSGAKPATAQGEGPATKSQGDEVAAAPTPASSPPEPAPSAPAPAADDQAQARAPAAPPTAPALPPPQPPQPSLDTPRATLVAVSDAIAGERWDEATSTLDDLLQRKKSEPRAAWVPEAEALKARIAEERKNAALLAEVDQAVAQKDGDRALARIQAIPATSVFKARALGQQPEAARLAVRQRLVRAQAAFDRGACDEVKAEQRVIQRLDPENTEADELVRGCRGKPRAPVAARPPAPHAQPAVAASGPTKARTAEVAQVRDAEEPRQDPGELIKQARDAWLRGQYAAAIDLSKKALKLRPGSTDAYQIIAVCACSQRDADGAQRAYAKLDERGRSMVRTTCLRNNVHLAE